MSVQQAAGNAIERAAERAAALAVGSRVEAVFHDGTVVIGTITARHWWFEHLMCYTVTPDADGRPYWEVPTFDIYPARDRICAIDTQGA